MSVIYKKLIEEIYMFVVIFGSIQIRVHSPFLQFDKQIFALVQSPWPPIKALER
jgi:hypothetical protein